MDNMKLFKKELMSSLKKHVTYEVGIRALTFLQDELNILFNSKIDQLKKKNNDYTVKPQYDIGKSKNNYSLKRIR